MTRFSILFPLVIALLISSCGTTEKKEDKPKDPEEKKELDNPELQQMMNELNSEGEETLTDGFHEIKYPNGKLKSTGTISNGKKEGLWTYYREDGQKWSECNFTNGESNGKIVSYHGNGQVYYIGYFTNGTKSGEWMFYDTEGKLIKEVKMGK